MYLIVETKSFEQEATFVGSSTDTVNDSQKVESDGWLIMIEFLTNAFKELRTSSHGCSDWRR